MHEREAQAPESNYSFRWRNPHQNRKTHFFCETFEYNGVPFLISPPIIFRAINQGGMRETLKHLKQWCFYMAAQIKKVRGPLPDTNLLLKSPHQRQGVGAYKPGQVREKFKYLKAGSLQRYVM
jgi:hypothetical protein